MTIELEHPDGGSVFFMVSNGHYVIDSDNPNGTRSERLEVRDPKRGCGAAEMFRILAGCDFVEAFRVRNVTL